MTDRIAILDFGSQFTQLIARRIRDLGVFTEIFPWNANVRQVLRACDKPEVGDGELKGIILSGGPQSIYAENAPYVQDYLLEIGVPVLGICYGMQALAAKLGGRVERAEHHEYGLTALQIVKHNALLPEDHLSVYMSHGDRVEQAPTGWEISASSPGSPIAAMAHPYRKLYALQFHPEVHHTEHGKQIIERFIFDVCGCEANWTSKCIIDEAVAKIRETVGDGRVLSGLSGGVDSTITTALVQKALGGHVTAVFIDTGLMRLGEATQVEKIFRPMLGEHLVIVDASTRFFERLKGVTDPEAKRKAIGEQFIREFEAAVRDLGEFEFLAQGTIYPDVIESQGVGDSSQRIKSHHNVGGLPDDMQFKLVEPLRQLFKDEVRQIGLELGIAPELVWRQPFPGPGLAVRCLGEVTPSRVATLQLADAIFLEELGKANLLTWDESDPTHSGTSQAFAVLLPVRSVGVMGDQRTYGETIALRAITSVDFMSGNWSRLPYELLARCSSRIVNEVPGVTRVVYDITSKPPATIEWE
jgi:GMP synthase (glutamine-hydrolysing)